MSTLQMFTLAIFVIGAVAFGLGLLLARARNRSFDRLVKHHPLSDS